MWGRIKEGGKILNGFAPDLNQEGPELRFEPKTVYHFPLRLAEEKSEWAPRGKTLFAGNSTQEGSVL